MSNNFENGLNEQITTDGNLNNSDMDENIVTSVNILSSFNWKIISIADINIVIVRKNQKKEEQGCTYILVWK